MIRRTIFAMKFPVSVCMELKGSSERRMNSVISMNGTEQRAGLMARFTDGFPKEKRRIATYRVILRTRISGPAETKYMEARAPST